MDLTTSALPAILLGLLLAAVAAGLGPAIARFAARRSVSQPVMCPVGDEQTVLAGLLYADEQPDIGKLRAESFSVRAHGALFTYLTDPTVAAMTPRDRIEQLRTTPPPGVPEVVTDAVVAVGATPDDNDPEEPGAASNLGRIGDKEFADALEMVVLAADDRTVYAGPSPLVASATPDSIDPQSPPMTRKHVPPSRGRMITTSLTLATMAALAPLLAPLVSPGASLTDPEAIAALLSLLVMAVTSTIISLVDLDTLYVDLGTWAAGSAAALGLAAIAATLAGDPGRIGVAATSVVVVFVFFEVSNRIFRILRGHDGQGFGDTLIVLLTVGVPVLLTGDPLVALWSVLGAQFAGIAGWAVSALLGKVNRETPFAFGPYLAFGWLLCLLVHLTGLGEALTGLGEALTYVA